MSLAGKSDDGKILWSSELRALARLPELNRKRDNDAIAGFFMLEYIPAPFTPYKGIHKLQAGHLLSVDVNGSKLSQW